MGDLIKRQDAIRIADGYCHPVYYNEYVRSWESMRRAIKKLKGGE